ncbi:MAG: efflux RND transporter periplasmic adaptor subunit [Burkholderiaceae bacterium]|nr:efflux RND transporter periplasmic adaptor subunit [Burkholderiaceae bacterium]
MRSMPSTPWFHLRLRSRLGAWAAVLGLAMISAGCTDQPNQATVTQKPDAKDVVIRPEMQGYFSTGKLEVAELSRVIEVAGSIQPDERLVTRIGASVLGRVTSVLAEVGDRVTVGQPLARVASPELTQAQVAYLRANATFNQAERAVERAQVLVKADVIGTAELQRRESELNIARAELRAAGDQLALMGMSSTLIESLRKDGVLNPNVGIPATQGGVVIERKVSQGQVATPGDPLFTVADLSRVWVVGQVPEQIARHVQAGQSVEIEVPALRNKKLLGKITLVGDTISPETRTVTLRTVIDNPTRGLKPSMLVTMRIQGDARSVPVVPLEAVVREDDRDHVFVKKSDNVWTLTPVELESAVNESVRPVLSGIPVGTEIIVKGAFHLNNERRRVAQE